jgi:hypothetical protein
MLAITGHVAKVVGIVRKDHDVMAGRTAAYTAALNAIALTKKQMGSLNGVSHVARLGVYVSKPTDTNVSPIPSSNTRPSA